MEVKLKPSVYSLNDLAGIIRKNKFDVLQILTELNGDNSLPLVYETQNTCDLSYAGMMLLAKQKGIKVKVVLVSKRSERFVSLGKFDTATPATAKATNPITKVTQFGAASYPITMWFSDEVIRHIVGRLAARNAIEKVIPHHEVLAFVYQASPENRETMKQVNH